MEANTETESRMQEKLIRTIRVNNDNKTIIICLFVLVKNENSNLSRSLCDLKFNSPKRKLKHKAENNHKIIIIAY